jgi:hypothetical protein
MTKTEQIQDALNLKVDDVWGDKTDLAVATERAASRARHGLAKPAASAETADATTLERNPPRWPKEADAPEFYGHSDGSAKWEAENLVTFDAPYTLYMDGTPVNRIRCHKKVADSLKRILSKIQALYDSQEKRRAAGVDQYDGCHNYRSVRGATHLSMHAYGAAIDLDSAHNPLGATHGTMPAEVVAIFKAEGWRWGGDYSGRKDWMHFEACT